MNSVFNQRNFNRVTFHAPIYASLEAATLSFDNESTTIVGESIYILNMSASGLSFVSKEKLMVNFLTIYKFNLTLNGKELILFGKIIRKKEHPNHIFEYGVKFDFNYAKK